MMKSNKITILLILVVLVSSGFVYKNFSDSHKEALNEVRENTRIAIISAESTTELLEKLGTEGNIFERVDELRSLIELGSNYRTKAQDMRLIQLQLMLTNNFSGFGMAHEDAIAVTQHRLTPALLDKMRKGQARLVDRMDDEISHLKELKDKIETLGRMQEEIKSPFTFFFRYYVRKRDIKEDLKPLKIKSYDR